MSNTEQHDRAIRGRGASWNPANRFDGRSCEPDLYSETAVEELESGRPGTEFLEDETREIVSRNNSPDLAFACSVNPYRGCEHGCIYCYARPMHEYAGYSAGLDFETRIFVKRRAPELLRAALSSRAWTPQTIALCGATDPYQPVERRLRLTRGCLEVLAAFRNPAVVITKNRLITRDVDLLSELARYDAVDVCISITTLDLGLNRVLEPRTSSPAQRLEAVARLAAAGVRAGVLVAPVIPGLTDHEIPAILEAAARAGASHASYIMLRLPLTVAPLFERWLEEQFPGRREKVMNRVRALRHGRAYESDFATRNRGAGPLADHVERLFTVAARKCGVASTGAGLSTAAFRRPGGRQMDLF